MMKSGITQQQLIAWGGPEVFNQALALVNSGDVTAAAYDAAARAVNGKIEQSDGWEMPVAFTIEDGGRIRSRCPCRANQVYGQICHHVIAVGLALMVKEMDDIEDEKPSGDASAGEAEVEKTEEADFIEVPAAVTFYAYVYGSRASIAIELDACYGGGEIEFPACSVQTDRVVWLEDPDDDLVRRVRNLAAEKEAMKSLAAFGFSAGYRHDESRLYIADRHKLLNFLGAGIARLRRAGWRIDVDEKLLAITDEMDSIVPVVTVRDAPGGAFDVCYSFESRGVAISPIEIQAAINRGDGYVSKDGRVALLDNAAIATMHDVFRDCAATQGGAPAGWFRVKGVHAPFVRSSLDALADVVEVESVDAPVWRERSGRVLGDAGARCEPVSLGKLESVLRPYQKQGVYWMRFLETTGVSGLLADEMGLGKTLQTLTWLSLPRCEDAGRPALIVCPTSLVRNWEAEAQKFTPWIRTLVVSGPERSRVFGEIERADIVITSYALLQRDFDAAYLGRRFSAVVLDEAQHIKNRQTRNARAAKELDAARRLVLTGTPVENSVADVWSIFDFLMPGYLGDYEPFKAAYENPIADGGDLGAEAQLRLRRKLSPFILRRLKKTVAKDLPDKLVKVSYCPLPDDIQREYNDVLQRGRPGAKTKFEMLSLLMKLRQISSRGKTDAFLEQLDEAIDGGHRVLVFSQFVKQLHVLREALEAAGIAYCYLDGSTRDRLGECNRFNSNREIPVFLISLMAGGTGLNLTGADMVIHYDPWWNPAVEDQATDRAHRIGQKRQVYVIKMIAAGSVEEKVLALQRRKQAVIAATVETTDAAIVERLTAADLQELLS